MGENKWQWQWKYRNRAEGSILGPIMILCQELGWMDRWTDG